MPTSILNAIQLPPAKRMRPKLIVFVAIGTLVLSVLLAVSMLLDLRYAAMRNAQQASVNLALSLEQDITRSLGTYDLSLQAAAKSFLLPGLAEVAPETRHDLLFDGAARAPYLAAILLTDAQGRVVYGSQSLTPPSIDLRDRSYFRAHAASPDRGPLLTLVPKNRLTGEDVVVVSRRISNADGSFAGIVSGGIQLGLFTSRFNTLDLGQHGSLALYTSDAHVVVRSPAGEHDFGRLSGDPAVFAHVIAVGGVSRRTVSNIDGIDRIYYSRGIGGLPVVLSVGRAVSDVYADWWRETAMIGGALVVLAGLTSVLISTLARELNSRAEAERLAIATAAEQKAIFDTMADAVIKIDWDGTRRYMSAASQPMLGYAPSELVRRNIMDIIDTRDGETVRAALERLRTGAAPSITITYRVRRRDGSWQVSETRGRALPDGSGAILVVRDATDRLSLEDQLRRAQQLEAVGRLSAGVAHDFNNLLQAQMGSLELLRDALVGDERDDATAARHIEAALSLAERGAQLTHHLLSFSRQQVLQPRPVALAALLGKMESVLARTLGPRITLRIEVDADTGSAMVDPGLLETALLNLCFNARDAMAKGGLLAVTAHRGLVGGAISVGKLAAGTYVVVTVRDEGCGMTPEVIARSTEPFFTTKGCNGSGLGLSMVQGFASQSAGDLLIDSKPGVGTTIELWLPATDHVDVAPAIWSATPRAGRALVVDDTADVLVAVRAFLEGAGITVSEASSAEAALDVLRSGERFDMLVTDYAMPGLSGGDLVEEARELQPGLPVLVITGYAEETIVERLGDVRVLLKPFRRDDLLRAVHEAMATPEHETVAGGPPSEPGAS